MHGTGVHVLHINKHIQIRNVPPALHRKLMSRARKQNVTLSEYLRQEMTRIAALPTLQEMTARLKRLPPVKLDPSSAEMIRRDRALAETLAMPFYTRDRKLARATGHSARIVLI